MLGQAEIKKLKFCLENNIGSHVKLTAKKGKKKSVTRCGVIESIYPSIFVVKLDKEDNVTSSERLVSFSYTDVLTKNIELIICHAKR